jgi:hypothetical protein
MEEGDISAGKKKRVRFAEEPVDAGKQRPLKRRTFLGGGQEVDEELLAEAAPLDNGLQGVWSVSMCQSQHLALLQRS